MRALDTNILVAAHMRNYADNASADELIRSLAGSQSAWGIPWACVHEFIATVTNRRIFIEDGAMARAQKQIDAWLSSPSLCVLTERRSHSTTLARVLADSGVTGARIHDAKIAAICLDHGVSEIVTNDRDFRAFRDLKAVRLVDA